ncbi:MAG: alpha/beta hydrolase [Chloroflexota bacterium]|nr:alpha/beta hydrolase [Chloroflexota bacterium]
MPFAHVGDSEVHYRDAGDGIPVVFVHGNWATSSWWEPTLALLPPGLRGIAYDVRGRGQTSAPDGDYAIPSLAADLFDFADDVGLERFHVVGHSLGSAIAMEAALARPARLLTLVVVSPAWIDGMPASYAVPERQLQLKEDAGFLAAALRAICPAAPDDAFWRRLVQEGQAQRLEAALAVIPALRSWAPGDRVAEIRVPRAVISGALDAFTGGPNAERVATALGAELITLSGIGHGPMVEAPDAFMRALLASLGVRDPRD